MVQKLGGWFYKPNKINTFIKCDKIKIYKPPKTAIYTHSKLIRLD